jgi:hypothetical protein
MFPQLLMSEKPWKTSNLASAEKFENDTKSLLPTQNGAAPHTTMLVAYGVMVCLAKIARVTWILEDFHA